MTRLSLGTSRQGLGWREAVDLAAKGLARRPGRAALTVLAVMLATTLLVALLTISETAENKVLAELSEGGPLAGIKVAAAEPDPGQVDNDYARPGPPKPLDDEALERISALPDVASVVPVVSSRILVIPGQVPAAARQAARPAGEGEAAAPTTVVPPTTSSAQADRPGGGQGLGRRLRQGGASSPSATGEVEAFPETMLGVDISRIGDLPVTVLAGRLPDPSAVTEVAVTPGYLERLNIPRKEAKAVLGTELVIGAPRASERAARGIRLRGRWTRSVIVGVVAQEAGQGQIVAPARPVTLARGWTSSGAQLPGVDVVDSPYAGLFVVARGLDKVSTVRHQITAIGYSTQAPENLIASVQRYLRVIQLLLAGIGAIALGIAALGIANAMFAAVRERRREIGVLKAIGARDRDLLRVFLTEASMIGLAGGALGTLGGWLAAVTLGSVVNRALTAEGLAGIAITLPVVVAAGGMIGSLLLALLAGTVPALRAARLPAREAVGSL
jgi:ABC-type antimicrobial peptide transport system permease subunit